MLLMRWAPPGRKNSEGRVPANATSQSSGRLVTSVLGRRKTTKPTTSESPTRRRLLTH